MIKFNCTSCAQTYRVSDEYAGKKVRCKSCNSINILPGSKTETVECEDSIAAYNNLLKELLKAEKHSPTVEIES